MEDINLKSELEFSKKLALEAGKVILRIFNSEESKEVEYKKDSINSPLTKADLASNEVIMTALRKEYSEDGFLTEEEKDNLSRLDKRRVWIIDPIDGTKEFIKRTRDFTVNIGLSIEGEPVLGVIYAPVKNELYYAAKGLKAFSEIDGEKKEITVSKKVEINEMLLVMSLNHATEEDEEIAASFKETKSRGSSLKGTMVAIGEADAYIRSGPVSQWDVCAMNAIILEAGGLMTDLEGKPLKYNVKDLLIRGFVVTNNKAHQEILELISRVKNKDI